MIESTDGAKYLRCLGKVLFSPIEGLRGRKLYIWQGTEGRVLVARKREGEAANVIRYDLGDEDDIMRLIGTVVGTEERTKPKTILFHLNLDNVPSVSLVRMEMIKDYIEDIAESIRSTPISFELMEKIHAL